MATPSRTAAPGLLIPGVADPGFPAAGTPVPVWKFTGLEHLYYLQYLGPDGRTLNPLPGQAFAAGAITAVSEPYPLPDPPADGRWIIQLPDMGVDGGLGGFR